VKVGDIVSIYYNHVDHSETVDVKGIIVSIYKESATVLIDGILSSWKVDDLIRMEKKRKIYESS
jgi:hypothetical protein